MNFKVKVPGSTSNLGSGFDTFGLALGLYLEVMVEQTGNGLSIEATGIDSDKIPTDETNLIYRAMMAIFSRARCEIPDILLSIRNEIPLSRGLGSSGAATIAGLVCGNVLSAAALTNDDLLQLAAELEGHVENAAASLLGGFSVNCVEVKRVISQKVPADEDLKVVLIIPGVAISTNEARKVLPEKIPHSDAVFNVQRSALLTHCLMSRDYRLLKTAMQDKIHQPFRRSLVPGYERFEQTAYENGALGFCISGSGSAMLCFTQVSTEGLETALRERALEQNLRVKVQLTGVENEGTTVTNFAARSGNR